MEASEFYCNKKKRNIFVVKLRGSERAKSKAAPYLHNNRSNKHRTNEEKREKEG
jgi:hypothetical protein